MRSRYFKNILIIVLWASLALLPCQAAPNSYFRGKTITYIVATHAGGGYDAYGRLIAKYMEKYLPGTTIIVKNIPGAGHIIGCNQIYHAKPDGLTIGTFSTGLIYAQIAGKRGIDFDLAKMSWIGKAAGDPRVLVARNGSGLNSVSDLENPDRPWKFSANGPGSTDYNESSILSKILNWKIRILTGYKGNEDQMSMRRQETDAALGSLSSLGEFVEQGYGHYVFQIGGHPAQGVPLLSNTVKSDNASAARAIALIRSQAELARMTAGPPGIPAPQLAALRDAYKKATRDPELIAQAKQMGRPLDPAYGEDVASRVKDALDQPDGIRKMLEELLNN